MSLNLPKVLYGVTTVSLVAANMVPTVPQMHVHMSSLLPPPIPNTPRIPASLPSPHLPSALLFFSFYSLPAPVPYTNPLAQSLSLISHLTAPVHDVIP